MAQKSQKIHFKSILSNVGLLLHVPGIMAILSIIIAVIFKEHYAIPSLISTAVIAIGLGQLLYVVFKHDQFHIWDAMISAALGWFFCSIIAAIPFYLIAHNEIISSLSTLALKDPINSCFEAFSGFTSTGLSIVKKPEELPHVLQWWRSFLEWIGGMGLIVFIVSITESSYKEYQLYYAEGRTEPIKKSITRTTRLTWGIYFSFTLIGIILFYISGMPIWDSINNALSGISTGGFSVSSASFTNYSTGAQLTAIFLIILGMMSFTLHYKIIKEKNITYLWKNSQNRFLICLLIVGSLLVLLINYWIEKNSYGLSSVFQWVTSLGTCGFHSTDITKYAQMVKLLLIFAMIIGGATGSTAGGIKIRRFQNLLSSIYIRLKSISTKKEKELIEEMQHYRVERTKESPELELPQSKKTERLYSAGIIFSLWIFTLMIGWFFLLKWIPKNNAFDSFFDAASALSNCGLTLGVTSPSLHFVPKIILILLMWIGRLEIIPILILFFAPFILRFSKKVR